MSPNSPMDVQDERQPTPLQQPSAPDPSADPGVQPQSPSATNDLGLIPDEVDIDIVQLSPIAALRMLSRSIDTLVRMTGDVPPTPPLSHPTTPNLKALQAEKEEATRTHLGAGADGPRPHTPSSSGSVDYVDGVPLRKTPLGSPESVRDQCITVIGANAEPVTVQHGAITRKFYSKKPPPISLEDYLLRLHMYCPMSTAVYLAASLYIHKLAVHDRLIPVTARNAHRLLLASLRVGMKALEDFSYPHRRFAKVGGVTEQELGRLEISFCFLCSFELKVDADMLHQQAISLRNASSSTHSHGDFQPRLPPLRDRTKSSFQEYTTPVVSADA